jgi:cytidylate kinase
LEFDGHRIFQVARRSYQLAVYLVRRAKLHRFRRLSERERSEPASARLTTTYREEIIARRVSVEITENKDICMSCSMLEATSIINLFQKFIQLGIESNSFVDSLF